MANKKKMEYYDTFDGYTWEVDDDSQLSEDEILSHIKNNWLDPADAILKDLCDKKLIKPLACRYAHGEKWLASRTQQARSEYIKMINDELLPTMQKRRVVDVIAQRIKDILPNLAARVAVEETIQANPDLDDSQIAQLLYTLVVEKKTYTCQVPNTAFVKNIRAQMDNNDGVLPDFQIEMDTKFQLSVTDQLAEVSRCGEDRKSVMLTIKGGNHKVGKLVFKFPDNARYQTGKVALPDIMRTARNNSGVMFCFAVSHKAPQPYEPLCSLGADVGVIYPVVSALVGVEWYSQAFYPPGWVLDQVDKLNDLAFQKAILDLKIEQDSMPNRLMHEGQVKTYEELVDMYMEQRDGLAGKMSDIKRDLAQWAAHSLCESALCHKAQIAFEQLNWSNPSHAFFHSMIQERTKNLALVSGIPVVIVSAKDTSAKCAHEGTKLKQGRLMKPPAVKSGSKQRNGWRSVDKKSGLRDASTRKSVVKALKEKNPAAAINEYSLPFKVVEAKHVSSSGLMRRGAYCQEEGIIRDHDCVGARNIGVNGEIERGVISRRYCLSEKEFRRKRRRDSRNHFGWAVMLSASAAVSASAPVSGSSSCANDAVGPVEGGSPPS